MVAKKFVPYPWLCWNIKITKVAEEIKTLKGDSKLIIQTLRIILDNAIKYSQENSEIIIKVIDEYYGKFNLKSINGVLIQVIDSGIGINKEDLTHIFTRYHRAENARDIEGTGLGLSIAEELIHLHNRKDILRF